MCSYKGLNSIIGKLMSRIFRSDCFYLLHLRGIDSWWRRWDKRTTSSSVFSPVPNNLLSFYYSFMLDTNASFTSTHLTREECETLLSQAPDTKDVPEECNTLQSQVPQSLRRRQTSNKQVEDRNNAIVFAGMPSGSACAAMPKKRSFTSCSDSKETNKPQWKRPNKYIPQ